MLKTVVIALLLHLAVVPVPAWAASVSNPVAAPKWVSGFELGAAGTLGMTGAASFDTTTVRTGTRSLRINPAGAQANVVHWTSSTGEALVVRLAFQFASLPATDADIIQTYCWFDSDEYRIYYSAASGRLEARAATGSVAQGAAIVAGQWYVLDAAITESGGIQTIDWQVDGTDQPPATFNGGILGLPGVTIGTEVATQTYDMYVDDVTASDFAGDYPIGDGYVLGHALDADGTHVNPSNFATDAGAGLPAGTWQRIDDVPPASMVDWVAQTNIGTTSYAEFGYSDLTESITPNAVFVTAGYSSTGNNPADHGKIVARRPDGIEYVVFDGDMSEAALTFAGRGVPAPVGGWTQAAFDGVTLRFGYSSDATPNPRLHATYVEASYPLVTGSPPATPSNTAPADESGTTDTTPTLQSSAFSDPDIGDTHASSQWQVRSDAGSYAAPVEDSGETAVALTSYTTGVLAEGRYHFRVRHRDNNGNWSGWSTETAFHVDTTPPSSAGAGVYDGSVAGTQSYFVAGSMYQVSWAGFTDNVALRATDTYEVALRRASDGFYFNDLTDAWQAGTAYLPTTATSFTFSGFVLALEAQAYAEVRAFDTTGASSPLVTSRTNGDPYNGGANSGGAMVADEQRVDGFTDASGTDTGTTTAFVDTGQDVMRLPGSPGLPNWYEAVAHDGSACTSGITSNGGPCGRRGTATGYNPATNRLIVWGGNNYADLWMLTNANGLGGAPVWTRLMAHDGSACTAGTTANGNPCGRERAGYYYHAPTNQLFIFGGLGGAYFNDVWMLDHADGSTGVPAWTRIRNGDGSACSVATGSTGNGGPCTRQSPVMAYHAASNRLIAGFGAIPDLPPAYGNDMWVLTNADGTGGAPTWNQVTTIDSGACSAGSTPTPTPCARWLTSMAIDQANDRVFLVAGLYGTGTNYNDVWVANDASNDNGSFAWTQLLAVDSSSCTNGMTAGGAPCGRNEGTAAYDPDDDELMLFAGSDATNYYDDVYVISDASGTLGTTSYTRTFANDTSGCTVGRTTSGNPCARSLASRAAFDSATNRFISFGGRLPGGTLLNDVWVRSGPDGSSGYASPATWYSTAYSTGQPTDRLLLKSTATVPALTTLQWDVSADGGGTWVNAITPGTPVTTADGLVPGSSVLVRATLTSSDPDATARVDDYSLGVIHAGGNTDPNTPVHVTPADTSSTADSTPTLTATHSDPDADTGKLHFEVCDVAMAAGQTCVGAGGTVEASGSSPAGIASGSNGSWTPGSSIADGTWYWHARAEDSNGAFSGWSAGWSLTIAAPSLTVAIDSGTVSLADGLSGVDSTGTSVVSVTTDAPNGYVLSATDPSDAWGMEQPAVDTLPDWTGTDAAPTPWPAGTGGYFGVSVLAAGSGKDTARWGTGTAPTDFATLKWAGLRTTETQLHVRTGFQAAADDVTIAYRANASVAEVPGPYSVSIAYTAVAVV